MLHKVHYQTIFFFFGIDLLAICIFFRICPSANVGMDFGRIYYIPVSPFFLGAVQHLIRDLEQIAEHIAANALYRIEADKMTQVIYDAGKVRDLLSD